MPNHVYNTIVVHGESEFVELLDVAVKTSDILPFDFNRIIPHPAIVDSICSGSLDCKTWKDHPNRNWLDWNREHWGTKWNAYEFEECGDGRYEFCTAWNPPIPVIRMLSKLFPELLISLVFEEEGRGFAGSMEFQDGKD